MRSSKGLPLKKRIRAEKIARTKTNKGRTVSTGKVRSGRVWYEVESEPNKFYWSGSEPNEFKNCAECPAKLEITRQLKIATKVSMVILILLGLLIAGITALKMKGII